MAATKALGGFSVLLGSPPKVMFHLQEGQCRRDAVHDENGLQFSSSRPLWAALVFVKAWAVQKM